MRLTNLTIITLLIFNFNVTAQIKAVTELGDSIYVYDNGTWSFELLDQMPVEQNELSYLSQSLKLDTLNEKFVVSNQTNKQVNDLRDMFYIKYSDLAWKRVPPATLNEDADFAFQSRNTDIWCVVIAEETPIAADKLFLIAKNNMKEYSGQDPEVVKAEIRNVNGHDLLRGVMKSEIQGIKFVFDTYYFSNDLGSVQFTTWAGDKVWERNEQDILNLLNGFVVK